MKKIIFFKKFYFKNLNTFFRKKILNLFFLIRPNGKIIYNLSKNTKIFLKKDEISYKLFSTNNFENDNRSAWEFAIKKGMNVFDIGANCGIYSIIASNLVGKKGKVFAFEPNRNEIEKLKANLNLNKKFTSNLKVIEKAVGDYTGHTLFHVPDSFKGAYGSIKRPDIKENCKSINIPIISIDDFISQNNITKADLFKIDVEGNELNVLKGAENTINKFQPIILMEVSDRRTKIYNYKAKFLCDFLLSMNYTLYLPKLKRNKIILKKFTPQNFISYVDIFAVPQKLKRNINGIVI